MPLAKFNAPLDWFISVDADRAQRWIIASCANCAETTLAQRHPSEEAMTPAEHAELSAQLARALGWPDVTDFDEPLGVYASDGTNNSGWFDYRDPSVALPLLEWLMREHGCRPMPWGSNISIVGYTGNVIAETFTLPEAIARAVIAVADAKRRQVEQNEAREVLQP